MEPLYRVIEQMQTQKETESVSEGETLSSLRVEILVQQILHLMQEPVNHQAHKAKWLEGEEPEPLTSLSSFSFTRSASRLNGIEPQGVRPL